VSNQPARIGFLPDTSVIVAALCGWHDHHEVSLAELERRLRRGEGMIVAAPALVEAYSVLTRLPAPHRLGAEDALAMLEAGFIHRQHVTTLTVAGYLGLLRSAPGAGVSGGRVYDAVIAACATEEKVAVLLTFNDGHFRPLLEPAIGVVVPGSESIS
jgi:predicted nucleic acid-binding protein